MALKTIYYLDMFAGIGGFREGLTMAGDFVCKGHCEIDAKANQSYNALFDTRGEWYCDDARKADPDNLPDFDLLCGGFPCQAFSIAGSRQGFGDSRGTLFFEFARLAEARQPKYLFFENVPGLLSHDGGRTFAAILDTLDRLGFFTVCQRQAVKTTGAMSERRSSVFQPANAGNKTGQGVPQSRRRVYIIGYLDERCRGKIFPFTETAGTALVQKHGGWQGERIYGSKGVSCTLAAQTGGFGGKTGLYEVPGLPIKSATKSGYQLAYPGDSVDLSYATSNNHRGRVGYNIAHTLTTGGNQGVLEQPRPVRNPIVSDPARNSARTGKPEAPMYTLTTKDHHGVTRGSRIRRLTPRECLRLQGWRDERIDCILPLHSDNQLYKQAGNGVTVNVITAIGKRIVAMDAELRGDGLAD